eukprot:3804756-Rhodomonas_salina.1
MNVTESLRKSALRSSKLLQSFNPFSAHEDSEDDEEDSLFPKPGSFGAIDEEEVGNDTDEQENMQTKLGKARARHKVLSVFADSLDLHRVHKWITGTAMTGLLIGSLLIHGQTRGFILHHRTRLKTKMTILSCRSQDHDQRVLCARLHPDRRGKASWM